MFMFVFVLSVRNFMSLVSIKPLDFKARADWLNELFFINTFFF